MFKHDSLPAACLRALDRLTNFWELPNFWVRNSSLLRPVEPQNAAGVCLDALHLWSSRVTGWDPLTVAEHGPLLNGKRPTVQSPLLAHFAAAPAQTLFVWHSESQLVITAGRRLFNLHKFHEPLLNKQALSLFSCSSVQGRCGPHSAETPMRTRVLWSGLRVQKHTRA